MSSLPFAHSARRRLLAALALSAITLGFLLFGHRVAARERLRVHALQQQNRLAEAHVGLLRAERDRQAADLAAARQQLAELQAGPASADPSGAATTEIPSWLTRVKRLKQLFADHPEQRIPELLLLTDRDWLALGKTASFERESDTRRALAAARTAAKRLYCQQISGALSRYMAASPASPPKTFTELLPYTDPPLDWSMFLQRYAQVDEAHADAMVPGFSESYEEKSAIDPDYDTRVRIWVNGGWGLDGSGMAWIAGLRDRRNRAYEDYARANYGAAPPNIDAVAPYFSPPLDPGLLEKLRRGERDRTLGD